MTMRWIGTGRSARGAPGPRCSRPLRWAAFALLALSGLLQTGCQSAGLCGPCGGGLMNPCRSGPCSYLKGLRERVFSRGTVSGGCCGSTLGGEAPLEMGGPAMMAPAGTPMTLPAAPAMEPPAGELTPAPIEPERKPSSVPDATGAKSSTNKANYEAARPRRYRLGRNAADNLSKAVATTSEPTTRSAQGSSSSPGTVVSESWLDNLPPVTIPRDDSREGPPDAVPAAPAAETSQTVVRPRMNVQLAAPAELSVAPGISRFLAVDSRLSGGSLPNSEGLDWLADRGYKTLLDLRETGDVQPSFIEEVTNRGLRYVALPIGLKKLDSAHVSRFELEISLSDARPLYFCDADGTRPGALWYIHRMTKDKVDPEVANREAVGLGLNDQAFVAAARAYLESLKPPPSPPAVTTPAPSELQTPSTPATDLDPQAATEPAERVTDIGQTPFESLNEVDTRDTTAWRSYAALVFTGLGVPLAYRCRESFPSFRRLSWASLPGPGRQPRSLPPSSGA